MKISYKSLAHNKETVSFELDKLDSQYIRQAQKDYETSFSIIRNNYYYLWAQSLKDYELSTYDRGTKIKPWQSNIPYGLIRSTIDVFTSNLLENPLKFSAIGRTKTGIDNRQNVEHILNDVADKTQLHLSIVDSLTEGLITGAYAFRTTYVKKGTKMTVYEVCEGEVLEEEIEIEYDNHPVTMGLDIFSIFPDMYPGKMRYITERKVTNIAEFRSIFDGLLFSKDNNIQKKIGKKAFKDYIDSLCLDTGGNKEDFGKIRMMIYEKENEIARMQNAFELDTKSVTTGTQSSEYDEDLDLTESLIEWKITTYADRIIIKVNDNLPVYSGKNVYGFMNYKIGSAFFTRARFSLGIGYTLRGFEGLGRSYMNNMVDGVRSTASPTFVANKSLLLSERSLRNAEPGGIIYVDGTTTDPRVAITRLDKGTVTDNGVMQMADSKGQMVSGVSEYNLGQSAGERTAAGATSVVDSSLRRMRQYLFRFANVLGEVGNDWLKLIRKYRTEKEFVSILDEDSNQTYKELSAKDTGGVFTISLHPEGMLAASKDLELKRLTDMYNLVAGSGIADMPQHIAQMYRAAGYNPGKFIVNYDQKIPLDRINKEATQITDMTNKLPEGNAPTATEGLSLDNKMALTGQLDMGNGGEGAV